MKMTLRMWFVMVMTFCTVMLLFAIGDAVLAGVVSLIVRLWNKEASMAVFKWVFSILFTIETVLSVPATIKSCKGDIK